MGKKDIFTFGTCKICGRTKPLKNDICPECEKKIDSKRLFDSLFGGFNNE